MVNIRQGTWEAIAASHSVGILYTFFLTPAESDPPSNFSLSPITLNNQHYQLNTRVHGLIGVRGEIRHAACS
jgi:hypothetical protein